MTKWGIKGQDWQQVRDIPQGEDFARGWAWTLSTSKSRRHGSQPTTITLYRDDGGGWQQVEVFEAKETAR